MAYRDLPLLEGAEGVLGHMPALRRNRLRFTETHVAKVERMARFVTPAAPGLVVNHPEVLQELLVEKSRTFEKSLITRFSLAPMGGEGLFTSRYPLWKRQRKLMAPLFHPAQLRLYAVDMMRCTDRGIAGWQDGDSFELLRETTRITMSIAGKTLFDTDTFGEADAIGAALTTALDWTAANAPSPTAVAHLLVRAALVRTGRAFAPKASGPDDDPPTNWLVELGERFEKPVVLIGKEGRKLREAIRFLDERVQTMIDARRAEAGQSEKPDLLSRLLNARDEDDGRAMTDKQIRDEVLTLFVAGHETTATALAWSIYCLCKNPDVYASVEREVDALPGDPNVDDLPRLALTLRVFKEALRLYPPVYLLGRQANRRASLDGVDLPRETIILASPLALHRRPDTWPEPMRFDPNRFLPENEASRHRLAWLPFGAGARVCIGNQFAMIEGQLVLAQLLRRARFELAGEEEPLGSATLRPKYGMRVRIRLRQAAAAGARPTASTTSLGVG